MEGPKLQPGHHIQRTERFMKFNLETLGPRFILLASLILACASTAGEDRALPNKAPARIELPDQYGTAQVLAFPAPKITVLTIADHKGAEQVDGWIALLRERYAGRINLVGVADVSGAPGFMHSRILRKFRETRKHPIMMDWSGKVCAQFGPEPHKANILILAGF